MMNSKAEARPLVNHAVLVERFRNDDKHYKLYTSFAPSFTAQSVTGKFYSKYDQIDATKADPTFLKMIELRATARPKDKWSEPVLESHKYGWYTDPLIDLDKSDLRLHHPMRFTEISRFGVLLMKAKHLMKK